MGTYFNVRIENKRYKENTEFDDFDEALVFYKEQFSAAKRYYRKTSEITEITLTEVVSSQGGKHKQRVLREVVDF